MRVKPIAVWPSIDIIMFPPITPKNPQRKMIQYYVKIALAVVATFLLPIAPLMALVGAAIIGDTILGVWAAKRSGEKICSRKLGAIIPKMLLYQAALIFGFCVDIYLVGEFLTHLFTIQMLMTKVITLTLLYVEMVSVDENFEKITGKNVVKAFKGMITRAKKVKEMVEDLAPSEKEEDSEQL